MTDILQEEAGVPNEKLSVAIKDNPGLQIPPSETAFLREEVAYLREEVLKQLTEIKQAIIGVEK